MTHIQLPRVPEDLLAIPAGDMPEVFRRLVRERGLSQLIARIHSDMRSDDPVIRHRSGTALRRLGFAE